MENVEEKKGDFLLEIGGIKEWFVKPSFTVWKFAVAAMEKGGAVAFKTTLAKNCCINKNSPLLTDEYLPDVINVISEIIDYDKATIEKDGNGWIVTVGEKSCKLKSVTIEASILADKNNAKSEAFRTKQNLLDLLWIDGDDEIKSEKHPELLIPVLGVLDDLRTKHIASIKKF